MSTTWINRNQEQHQINQTSSSKRNDLFSFIRITMRIAAMHPLELHRYLPWFLRFFADICNYIYLIYAYLILVHLAILHVMAVYYYLGERDLEYIVNTLIQIAIYCWAILMTTYFRLVRPQGLREIMELINSQYRPSSEIGFTYVSMDEALGMSIRFIKIFAYSCYIATGCMLLPPIIYGDRTLPLDCWYPIDYKQPYVYEVLYLLQGLAQLQVAAAFSVPTGFFMILAMLLSGQFDVLFCNLKNIIANVHITNGAEKTYLIKLQELQQNANAELNQYFSAKEHSLDLEKITESSKKLQQPGSFYISFKNQLKGYIEHHRLIMRILKRIEALYNFIWLLKTGEVTLVMCLVTFVSVKSTTTNTSFMRILSNSQYLIMVALEMLLICYAGQILQINSQRCGDALLRCPWYIQMRQIKSDVVIFVLNSQRPFKLTAGKLFDLNVERFRVIMTTAFSFLTLLQKMDKRG